MNDNRPNATDSISCEASFVAGGSGNQKYSKTGLLGADQNSIDSFLRPEPEHIGREYWNWRQTVIVGALWLAGAAAVGYLASQQSPEQNMQQYQNEVRK